MAPVTATATAAVEISTPTIAPPIQSRCPATEIVRNIGPAQDFNDGRWDGWTNGRSEQSERETYGLFLGRYEQGEAFPHRDFVIPGSSQRVYFQYDFLEIDSWDGLGANGPDTAGIKIEGDEGLVDNIVYGGYDYRIAEGTWNGVTDNGIIWEVVGDTFENSPQGFLAFQDQRHRVTIEVPSQFYSDNGAGTLRVTLQWTLTGEKDESIGFDNFSAVACEDTVPSTQPSMTSSTTPSQMPSILRRPAPSGRRPSPTAPDVEAEDEAEAEEDGPQRL